jgi:hypothetical protein
MSGKLLKTMAFISTMLCVMLFPMQVELGEALKAARREIELIDSELRRLGALNDKRHRLEEFIQACEALMKPVEGPLRSVAETVRESRAEASAITELQSDRIWMAIQLVMSVRKKPMTASEVLEALTQENFRVHGEHKRESVRSAMNRKPEIFEKVERGLFALVGWPEEIKQSRAEDSLLDATEE